MGCMQATFTCRGTVISLKRLPIQNHQAKTKDNLVKRPKDMDCDHSLKMIDLTGFYCWFSMTRV